MPTFDDIQQEFRDHIGRIEDRLRDGADGDDGGETVRRCETLLTGMELKIGGDQEREDVFRACQLQLTTYRALDKAHRRQPSSTEPLFDAATERRHREETWQQLGRVGQQNSHLNDALRSIRETEEVGSEIAAELAKNRKKIEATHGNVKALGGMAQRADGLIKSMSKKWYQFW